MVLLLICIVLNTFIGVVFKLFNKFQINVLAAIVVNYFTCVITGSIIEGNWLIKPSIIEEKWFYYALSLGVIFIITFNLVAWTIKEYGIMIATIFQKMSLLFPTMIAIFIYQETNSLVKSLGIVMAMTAIILISFPSGKRKFNWVLFWVPLGTWIFSGLIESSLYYVNIENIVSSANISFVTSIFFFAGFFGLLMLILQLSLTKLRLTKKDIIAGIGLGIPNFFSIYILLYLLSKDWGGSVLFPINNVGILTLATIVGIILFKEKIDKLKIIGFAAAAASIIMVAVG